MPALRIGLLPQGDSAGPQCVYLVPAAPDRVSRAGGHRARHQSGLLSFGAQAFARHTSHAGPLDTADIKRVLIEGAQGVRSLSALLRRHG